MQFLSISEVLELHKELVSQFGGMHGVRDKKLLDSALEYPKLLYSIAMERDEVRIAAAYAYHLIGNHPFLDGNKRIGTLAMLVFLRINDVPLRIPKKDLYALAMDIAQSKIDEERVALILKKYVVQP